MLRSRFNSKFKIQNSKFVVVILFVFFLSTSPAIAATSDSSSAMSSMAGSVRIIPGIIILQEYNDNIGFNSVNKIDDHITTASPSLLIEYKQERLSWKLQEQVDFSIYADHDEFNSIDHEFNGNLDFKATSRLSTSLSAKHVRDARTDRDIESTGLVNGTARREQQSYSGSITTILTEKAMAGISVSYDKTGYDDPEFVDSRTQGAGFNFGYNLHKWLTETTMRLYLNANRYDYPGSESKYYSATTGMERLFSEKVTGSVYLGGRYISTEIDFSNSNTDSWGGVAQAMLGYTGEKGTASINLSHDIAGGRSNTSGVTERSSASINLGRKLSSEWRVDLSTSWYLNRSDDSSLAAVETDEHTFRVVPAIRYSYSRDLYFVLHYAYVVNDNRTTDVKKEQSRGFLKMVLQHAVFE